LTNTADKHISRQTEKQTDNPENITPFFSGGNSLTGATPPYKVSAKSAQTFLSNPADEQLNRQTEKQTDRPENITPIFGGSCNRDHIELKL